MRLNAYVLAADPAFLTASLRAYYPTVDRIVVSFDQDHRSWSGRPLPVAECLAAVRALDVDGKCTLAPGAYSRPDEPPLDSETIQRQKALDLASDGADWVLQLDTDEVIPHLAPFLGAIDRADAAGARALHYPSRWLYTRVGEGRYLETSTRWGRSVSHYPGPLAVAAGTTLTHCRQAEDAPHYRIDVRPWNTDRNHPRDAIVHEVVAPRDAVLHFSWVRSAETMRDKFAWSGHADQFTVPAVYRRWAWRSRHPRLTAAMSLVRPADHYRVVRLPEPPGGEP